MSGSNPAPTSFRPTRLYLEVVDEALPSRVVVRGRVWPVVGEGLDLEQGGTHQELVDAREGESMAMLWPTSERPQIDPRRGQEAILNSLSVVGVRGSVRHSNPARGWDST